MDKHFLYLPLYYARDRNWFGLIPEKRYGLSIYEMAGRRSDKGAVKALLDPSSENEHVHFAICDPAAAIGSRGATQAQRPVVLGSLITNASFWAIDTESITVNSLGDLAKYDRIISFPQGSTSFAIARQACCSAGLGDPAIKQKIKPVRPGLELTALMQAVRLNRSSEQKAVALSPNLFGIDRLLYDHTMYSIDLELGTTTEYSNVLVTALLSRQDVVDDHPELVSGLLKALQVALIHIQGGDHPSYTNDAIVEYGSQTFGDDQVRVRSALERAMNGYVFPPTVIISPAQWRRSEGIATAAWGSEDSQGDSYQVMVEPYSGFARDAVAWVFSHMVLTSDTATPAKEVATVSAISWWLILVVFVSLVLGGCLVHIGGWGVFAVGFGACIWGIVPLDRLRIGLGSRTGGYHFVCTLGIAACVLLLLPTYFNITDVAFRWGVAGILVTLLSSDLAVIDTHSQHGPARRTPDHE